MPENMGIDVANGSDARFEADSQIGDHSRTQL